jgi:hypothetical protein
MLVNTKTKLLNLNKCSINQDISSWIEQDIIVPDTKPDALKIVNITVKPYINTFDITDGKIKISVKINYFIIYKASDDKFGNRGLYISYPYTEVISVNNVKNNMDIIIEPYCKNVIFSLPNERKISIKIEICFKVNAKERVNINVIEDFEYEGKIESKTCDKLFQNIIQTRNSIIASKEDIMLPKEAEDFFELLKVETQIIDTDYKDSYNKIMVKGDILTQIIYLSENPNEKVKKVSLTIPFSAMIELDNISEKSKFDIKYILQDFNIKLNSDITSTKTMSAEYQIDVEVTMYEEEEIEYIDDFYSQTKKLDYSTQTQEIVSKNIVTSKNIDIKENISNILPLNTTILDYCLDTNNISSKIISNIVELEGNVKISLLLQNLENLELETKNIDVLVNEKYDINSENEEIKAYINILGEGLNVIQNNSDIEVKLTLVITTNIEDITKMSVIEKIEDMPLDLTNLDSINLYVVKPGDSLWNIAKKYKTSIDKIVKINNIEDPDKINIGQKILVIR